MPIRKTGNGKLGTGNRLTVHSRRLSIAIAALCLCVSVAHSQTNPARTFIVAPAQMAFESSGNPSASLIASSGLLIDAATHKLAYKFIAPASVTVTGFDIRLSVGGSTTGITLKGHIETDSSDAPSGSTVGSSTSAFAAPSSTGWTGLQSFASTASLTQNTFYWLVLEDGGGTAPTGTNFTQGLAMSGSGAILLGGRGRQYNGTNWTTTTAVTQDGDFVLAVNDGSYIGIPTSGAMTPTPANQVYSTTRTGNKFRIGGGLSIVGFYMRLTKTGSPSNLEISLYKGSALQETVTIAAASLFAGTIDYSFYFSTSYPVTQGTDYYLYLHQVSDGGTSGNKYALYTYLPNSTYISALLPSTWSSVFGTAADPTGFSTTSTEIYDLWPIVTNIGTGTNTGGTKVSTFAP